MGGGGGQPHLHGDPFGSWCLYSLRNYTTGRMHPPQIGWAFDGVTIYGRHVSTENYGSSLVLDDCGGHSHGIYGYHYHAQVLTAYTDSGAVEGQAAGQPYYASTTGPYQCLKGDISKITNYFGSLVVSHTSVLPDTTTHMCSGTTKYYAASGIILPNTLSTPSAVPTPAPSAPSFAPTGIPSFSPSTTKPSLTPTGVPSFSPSTATPSQAPTYASATFIVQQVTIIIWFHFVTVWLNLPSFLISKYSVISITSPDYK